ncbi:MAG: Holliday junction branch migration protein RuvA [Eubacterium sp.]|nr:Holliday junction branch migration protein RuvA [Eubacterium sp.]
MIGFVKGRIAGIKEEYVIVENQGIGWQIYVPSSVLGGQLHAGEEVRLFTWLHVREDILQLYGFLTEDDLDIFKLLIGVSGIGPKGALGILSFLSADELRFAVLSDDAARISKAPGIGKKTAQKLILELKDKFSLDEAFEKKLSHNDQNETGAPGMAGTASDDAVQALVALGYSGSEALQAVRKVKADGQMDSEAILKAALKFIL